MLTEKPSGRELGRKILVAIRHYVGRQTGAVRSECSESLQRMQAEIQSKPSAGHMQAAIELAVSKVKTTPGADGKSVSLDDVRPTLDAFMARCELDLERRVQERCERAIAALRQPEDGKDGGSIEDFDIAIEGRTLTVQMTIGEDIRTRTVQLPIPYDAGVYKSGQAYQSGAIVTFAGSAFIASRDANATEAPEKSTAWRLLVKRGRDGKDAE